MVLVLLTDWLRIRVGLFHHVLVYIGDLHLVHPALNLSILDAGILIMVQQVTWWTPPCPSSCCPPEICLAGQVECELLLGLHTPP